MNYNKKNIEELNRLSIEQYKTVKKLPIYLVLDNIRSKYNVGSIFRTADAFRIEKIFLCGITPCPPDREIEKTALGATKSVDWQYLSDTLSCAKLLKDQMVFLLAVEQTFNSTSIINLPFNLPLPIAIILGHEIKGVDDKILEMVNIAVEIPQWGTKHSLNVSVAAGITMWEVVKRNIDKIDTVERK